MIENGLSQEERLEKLNNVAIKELQLLSNDKNIVGINKIESKEKLLN